MSSAAARCSITSAIDQRSGATLKFHCASDNPLVASITPFLVDSRYCNARSLSACEISCAREVAALHTINKMANPPVTTFLMCIPSLSLFILELAPTETTRFLRYRLSLRGPPRHQFLGG